MQISEIKEVLTKRFGESCILSENPKNQPCTIEISPSNLWEICHFLYHHEHTYFDFLSCIIGIDNGVAQNTMEVIYQLYSIPYNHSLAIKVTLVRNQSDGSLPQVSSVSDIWAAANWHEREIYDLLGVHFTGHPDLRRILLPHDWQGHPLRKDYQEPETYHQIQVKY